MSLEDRESNTVVPEESVQEKHAGSSDFVVPKASSSEENYGNLFRLFGILYEVDKGKKYSQTGSEVI